MLIARTIFLFSQLFVLSSTIAQAANFCNDLFLTQDIAPAKPFLEHEEAWRKIKSEILELASKAQTEATIDATIVQNNILTEKLVVLANRILDDAIPRGFDMRKASKAQEDLLDLLGEFYISSVFDPLLGVVVEQPMPVIEQAHFIQIIRRVIAIRMTQVSPAIQGFQTRQKIQKNDPSPQSNNIGFLREPKTTPTDVIYTPVWDLDDGRITILEIPRKKIAEIGFKNLLISKEATLKKAFSQQDPLALTKAFTRHKATWEKIKSQFMRLMSKEQNSSTRAENNILTEKLVALANQILDEAFPRGGFDPEKALSAEQKALVNLMGEFRIHTDFDQSLGKHVAQPLLVTEAVHFTQIIRRIVMVRTNSLSPEVEGFQPIKMGKKTDSPSLLHRGIGFLGKPKTITGDVVYYPVFDLRGGRIDIVEIPVEEKQKAEIGFSKN
ncbi:MAG: hypothetical protein A4S09_11575 [Proteobacteria bacterium SG_bin7]|nr:MAG: hypothetical protein A4S09_11575 [Proteobacteria bacterium SG_bin7]